MQDVVAPKLARTGVRWIHVGIGSVVHHISIVVAQAPFGVSLPLACCVRALLDLLTQPHFPVENGLDMRAALLDGSCALLHCLLLSTVRFPVTIPKRYHLIIAGEEIDGIRL